LPPFFLGVFMGCFHPLYGFRSPELTEKGKHKIVFDPTGFNIKDVIAIPCGRCAGCRIDLSREWATRCVHEASLYDSNCFITLTYNDEHLPKDGSLVKKHFQDFMKRLRERFSDTRIRFFHCGEYGGLNNRPHYHALLFNFDFPDRIPMITDDGKKVEVSEILNELWKFGFTSVGDVTFKSAAYVARYCIKKIHGEEAAAHYNGRLPEYCTMSRRPGIAADWIKEYAGDVYPHDFVVVDRVRKLKPPRFYDNKYLLTNEKELSIIKETRVAQAKDSPRNTWKVLRRRKKFLRYNLSKERRAV